MKYRIRKWHVIFGMAASLLVLWAVHHRVANHRKAHQGAGSKAVPVEVAAIAKGPIELRRTFSGSLESTAEFMVAPKVGGRVEQLAVDLSDRVARGQVVARLDDDEYVQAVAQAEAELAVARANLSEAESALEIADRELGRVQTLRERGVASDSKFDTSKIDQLTAKAKCEVAAAQRVKAAAALETARIRLNYTQISADWTGGGDHRVVAQRFVDEGDTVSANTPLMSIVELDPITGVIYVTEKDYARLVPGQSVSLTTAAFPGETFSGHISRIAPVFDKTTRQARVELTVDNPDQRLKPGMFVRSTVVLERIADAVIVPETALTARNDRMGIFLVDSRTRAVSWRTVDVGVRQDGRVQVIGAPPGGMVVTLGQQLLDDGSSVTIPENRHDAGAAQGKGQQQ